MKSFILAVIAMVIFAGAAATILNTKFQKSADQAYTTSGVRIGEAH